MIRAGLAGRPELGVHLRGKALCDGDLRVADFRIRLRNLRVEIRPGLRRDNLGLALAFPDHLNDGNHRCQWASSNSHHVDRSPHRRRYACRYAIHRLQGYSELKTRYSQLRARPSNRQSSFVHVGSLEISTLHNGKTTDIDVTPECRVDLVKRECFQRSIELFVPDESAAVLFT